MPYGGKPDASWLDPTAHRDRWREVIDNALCNLDRMCGYRCIVVISEKGVTIIV